MNTTPELACVGAGNVLNVTPEDDRFWTPRRTRRIAAIAAVGIGTAILAASCDSYPHHGFMEYGQPVQVLDQFSLPDLSTSSVRALLEHRQGIQPAPVEQV